MRKFLFLTLSLGLFCGAVRAEDISLPAAQIKGGLPLMEALGKRATIRDYNPDKELSRQTLSNLLWAAWGINRKNGDRTAPSSRNSQEHDLYVLMATGAFRYDAKANKLLEISAEDLRSLSGTQPYIKDAPVTLVLVADLNRVKSKDAKEKSEAAWIDAGFISQNVYLYCASEGLATVVRSSVTRKPLAEKLGLRAEQEIIVTQCVGYPEEK